MERRFQVFIRFAGQFPDGVRQPVALAVMSLGCTPVVTDTPEESRAEQEALFRRLIEDCDYYVLVIGGQGDAGPLRYALEEYVYAASVRLETVCLVQDKARRMPPRTPESNPAARTALKALRAEAKGGTTVRSWSWPDELPGLTALTLATLIRSRPAVGWVRGNLAADGELLSELDRLRGETRALKEQLARQFPAAAPELPGGLAGMDGEVTLRLRSKSRTHPQWEAWSATLKWRDLFGSIGPHLFSGPDDDWVRLAVTAAAVRSAGREAFRHELEDDDFQSVKMHLRALRLIELAPAQTPRGRRKLIWSLTRLGEQVLLELRAAHAASAHPDQLAPERSAGAGPGPAAPDSGPLPIRLRGGEADAVQTV